MLLSYRDGRRIEPVFQPPIEDHGLIGDCRSAALVCSSGSIDWLCLPHYSSPSLFARLLDECGGHVTMRPAMPFKVRRKYRENTAVLETEFHTQSGTARLTDLVPIVDGLKTLQPMREVLRIVEGLSGDLDFEIQVEPRPDYARRKATLKYGRKLGWRFIWSNEFLAIRTNLKLERFGNELRGAICVHPGERYYLSLAYSHGDLGSFTLLGDEADRRLEATLQWWQGWSKSCSYRGHHREQVLRSALTLKLLSFCLSGAIVAAPTASLPETLGGARNWDYRYCWLRDAGWTMQAFIGLGFSEEARHFLSWLLHATRLTWPELHVVYDVFGRTRLREQELDHFAGYHGSRPVRIGNGAYRQRQLDVYGEVVFAADAYVQGGGTLEPVERRMLKGFGEVVCKQWREPDHGIWEIRGEPKHYTFSKLMCWVALDRLLKLDDKEVVPLGRLRDKFQKERDELTEAIEENGYNSAIKSYTLEFNGESVDASLLLMPCLGFKDANDSRVRSTYDRIWERLGCNGLLYRYERGHDDLPDKEATFGICTFWAVHHLASRRDFVEAKRLFEHALTFANDVGLFAEEINPENGAALGNFPQAFTHIGLINAALSLEQAG